MTENPSGSDTGSGGADLDKQQTHLFHLTVAEASRYDAGTIQQANEHTFPILSGQAASAVLTVLRPGGIREPHWHPSAWEVNYVISGEARWSVVEPEDYHDTFQARAGDLVFLPPCHVACWPRCSIPPLAPSTASRP
jgi:oxalate decarboxylase